VIRRLTIALVTLLALAGGCGLSEDSGPQAIAPENLPPDLLDPDAGTNTTRASSGSEPINVYFLETRGNEVHLVKVERQVADSHDPGDRLLALLSQPTEDEAEDGITTSIPADTTLRAVPVLNEEDRELVIDLSSGFLSIEGPELPKAFAQIVWTVTDPGSGVDQVLFLVDGEEIRAQNADGAEQEGAVERDDYNAFR
jgi:spore germination protein GerM